MSWHSSSI